MSQKRKDAMSQKRKERAETRLYTVIKVARSEDLVEQIGKDIYFGLVDHKKVRSFRVQKQMPFRAFKEEAAKKFGIPVQYQRFWLWTKRQNGTYRPHHPLTPQEEAQSVEQLREVSNEANNSELKLFLEVELGQDFQPVPLPEKTKEDILLFFKLYDPFKEELRYVGRMFVKGVGKPIEILTRINKMAGFGPDEDIDLYEEIKFEPTVMCPYIHKNLTFLTSKLKDGDIICFQKSSEIGIEQCRYPGVPSFLEYVHKRQVVRFQSLEKPKEKDFTLELSKLHSYDDVVERVACHLGLHDPSKIRLTSHNCYSRQPKPQPIKYRGVEHLSDMLVHYNQTSDILYYEVLDIPLPELQGLKTLKVAFHHSTKDEVVIHTIRLPKLSTVGDVLDDLRTKVELSHPNAELRLLEVFHHKIYKIFPPGDKIENINDLYWTLRAEEIPEEEKNIGPHDRVIHVYHFMKDTAQNQVVLNFGEPFCLVIHEGETLGKVKVRIQKKLQVPDVEFVKWKFAFLSLGRPEYLQDSDVVSAHFQRREVYERYLGLEHSDNAPKRSFTANQTIETETSSRKELIREDMDTFFEKLESEFASAKTVCSRELASAKTVCSQEVKEALLKVEEALSIAPADFDDSGRVSSIQKAIKVLCFSDCSSTFTLNQKAELLSMDKNFEELCKRAAKAFKEKNLILEKESIKLNLSQSLESNLIKFKVAKAETEEIEKKIATLHAQVDFLLALINKEERKKEKILGEKKEMFEVCKDSKLMLSALGKEWPEYEARVKAAEEEEKAVGAEWSRMKYFISSLREGLN